MDDKTHLLVLAMLSGKMVRLTRKAYIENFKIRFSSTAGSWVYILHLSANGTFQICSRHHEITNGLKPDDFL